MSAPPACVELENTEHVEPEDAAVVVVVANAGIECADVTDTGAVDGLTKDGGRNLTYEERRKSITCKISDMLLISSGQCLKPSARSGNSSAKLAYTNHTIHISRVITQNPQAGGVITGSVTKANNNNNIIRPKLEYACIALSPLPTHTMDKLERFQRKAASVCLRLPFYTPADHSHLLRRLTLSSLHCRRNIFFKNSFFTPLP